ncbi:MAG: hypothetical protein ACRCSK_08120, partial [Fusobacteriaceae bacterium]
EKDIFKSALEVASFENTKNFKLEPKILENILEKNLEKISEENKILDLDFSNNKLDETKIFENFESMTKLYKNFSFQGDEKRKIGNAIHFYFENILYGEESEKELSKKKVLANFAIDVGVKKLSDILNSKNLENTLQKYSHIFSKDWDFIFPEYPIKFGGEQKRIDRLMIKNPTPNSKGKILIVDYKTGSKNDEQIFEYKIAVESELRSLGQFENYFVETEFVIIDLPTI